MCRVFSMKIFQKSMILQHDIATPVNNYEYISNNIFLCFFLSLSLFLYSFFYFQILLLLFCYFICYKLCFCTYINVLTVLKSN